MKKKLIILLLIPLFISCSVINQPKFKNKANVKSKIISKYGEPTRVHKFGENEIWEFNYESNFKSDRQVVFDSRNKIIENKKFLKPFPFTFRYGFPLYVSLLAAIRIIGL